MRSSIFPILLLFILWFLLSGERSLFLLLSGFCAASLSYAAYVLCLRPLCNFSIIFSFRFLRYLAWLVVQIVISSFSLLRLIYSREIPTSNSDEQLVLREDLFSSDVLNTLFGLSVTLTPGTVTVLMDDNRICFHYFNVNFRSGIAEMKNYISDSLLR